MIEELLWLLRIGWVIQSEENAYSAGDLMKKEVWKNTKTHELRTTIYKPWF